MLYHCEETSILKIKTVLLLITSILMFLYPAPRTMADQSEGFTKRGRYWYDNWDINRNSAAGDDGYLPAVVFESLEQNIELAHQFGRWFLTEYSN